jgi:hypothetical protein
LDVAAPGEPARLAGRRVSCASAGHHSAVLLAPDKPPRPVIEASGRVIGMLPDNPVTAETLELAPGETLVLFTDGVSEARRPTGSTARWRTCSPTRPRCDVRQVKSLDQALRVALGLA